MRASDIFFGPIGTILHDDKGLRYVYVGRYRNTVGYELVFVHQNEKLPNPYIYRVALPGSFLKKFPDAHNHCYMEMLETETVG